MVTDTHTHARTFTQGLTHLIYFSGFKPPCTEIVRSKWTASDGGNERHNAPGEPPRSRAQTVLCRHLLVGGGTTPSRGGGPEERTGNEWEKRKKQLLSDFRL